MRRLAMYWTVRRDLFGSTHAFLPLTQTGEGALGRADLVALSSGFLVLVPSKKDRQALVIYDATKVGKADQQCRLRVAFYMFSIASERRFGASEHQGGFIVLAHGLNAHHHQQDKEDLGRILDVMPGQVDSIHILRVETSPKDDDDDDDAQNSTFNTDSAAAEMRRKFGKYGEEILPRH